MPEMASLVPLVGRWTETIDAPRYLDAPAKGEMTLEWLRDENVLLQRSLADEPIFPEGVSVVIAEQGEETFTVHYFDSRGVARVFRMSFEDRIWKLWREASGPDDFDQRFEGTLSEDGSRIEGAWHRVEDGEWLHDFDVTYARVD